MASMHDFVAQNRKRLLIFVLLVLLIPILIFSFTWIVDSNRVVVINKDPNYEVMYKPTTDFNKTLKDMGLWDRGRIYVTEDTAETVNSVKITFTTTPQLGLRQMDAGNKIQWSVGTRIDNGVLDLSVHISPEEVQRLVDMKVENAFNKQIAYIVLMAISNSTQNLDGYRLVGIPENVISKLKNTPNFSPFEVEYEN